ncbi:MAG TPA: NADPH:quinone reductase [Spirochaetia bacterium]|nr:NADPH:quinone reductase [Spirochaetia bacterium]
MKAIVVREFGGPEVLKLEEAAEPLPGAGQVLIRVKAVGVNPTETYQRSGMVRTAKPPYTPGSDAAGVVERVGSDVHGWRPGDRVYTAGTLSGSYAEMVLVRESQLHALPERVSFSQGAGINIPYATAFHALAHVAHARAGETVLIHGASGGVGIAACQLSRNLALTAIGTAGTDAGRALILREGARHAVDHRAADQAEQIMKLAGGRGVDVILEMLANVNLGMDLKLLAPKGRVVIIGSRGDVTITPRDLMGRDASVHGMLLWNLSDADALSTYAALGEGLEQGTLQPVVGVELPLAEAAQAHRRILEPGAHGKIVLIP